MPAPIERRATHMPTSRRELREAPKGAPLWAPDVIELSATARASPVVVVVVHRRRVGWRGGRDGGCNRRARDAADGRAGQEAPRRMIPAGDRHRMGVAPAMRVAGVRPAMDKARGVAATPGAPPAAGPAGVPGPAPAVDAGGVP